MYLCKFLRCLPILLLFNCSLTAQKDDLQFKVYGFEEGLTHRNVFKIQQDPFGFIWIATSKGLNRFDGKQFIHYLPSNRKHALPAEFIADLAVTKDSLLLLTNQNFLTALDPRNDRVKVIEASPSSDLHKKGFMPANLYVDDNNRVWTASNVNRTGQSIIQRIDSTAALQDVLECQGTFASRAITRRGDIVFVGYSENKILAMDTLGNPLQEYRLQAPFSEEKTAWVTQLQHTADDRIWALLNNGQVYFHNPGDPNFQIHPITNFIYNASNFVALFVEPEGNIWAGGIGALWRYDAASGRAFNFDPKIKEITENNCTYRQIMMDASDVIWVASDFGAIKVVNSDQLFETYLSEGNENCSNGYCSMRGIAEDDEGNMYFSYYNSIHLLNPQDNSLRPLFPQNDFFNFPFGLLFYKGSLWTGNGKRIYLPSLEIDTFSNQPSSDKGHLTVGAEGLLWGGYEKWLYSYDVDKEHLRIFKDRSQLVQKVKDISYVHQGQSPNTLWVGTTAFGLLEVDKERGTQARFATDEEVKATISSDRIIAIYEAPTGIVWLATANGLNRLESDAARNKVYTTEEGLPNNFINGMLSEGDTALWLSTDNGLSRFSMATEQFVNFYNKDGLSKNEFNRIAFHKAKDGRMYFGGLNGVNAFYPGEQMLKQRKAPENNILFTSFSKFDGLMDSIIHKSTGLMQDLPIELGFRDKFFTFEFALANYKNPAENLYKYKLDGYDSEWSTPSTLNIARFNGIPPGDYVFRAQASDGKGVWNTRELSIPVKIYKAFYLSWWFLSLCTLALLGIIYGISQYRVYRVRKDQRTLETLVRARTRELEREKKKSDDLLLNILPEEAANELKKYGKAKARRYEGVTVLFTDFINFSKIAEKLEPELLVAEIDQCFRAFDEIIEMYHLEKIKTIGDAYMCVGGMQDPGHVDAVKMVKAAMEIQSFMQALAFEKKDKGKPYFQARVGIHTGPVVGGIVGIKKFAYDIWGDTVNIASRMETHGKAQKINISQTTYELVKDYFDCTYRGKVTVKNKGEIDMYFVERLVAHGVVEEV